MTPLSKFQEQTTTVSEPVEGCSLCSEFEADPAITLQELSSHGGRRVLAESGFVTVLPSIGPLVAGHVLIVPRRHVLSILEASQERADVVRLLEKAASRVGGESSEVTVFEHGSCPRQQGYSGACVDHAHLHVLPRERRFMSIAMSKFSGWRSSGSLVEAFGSTNGHPYLLVGEAREGKWAFEVVQDPACVPSQYLRQAYSAARGGEGYTDWRANWNIPMMGATTRLWDGAAP